MCLKADDLVILFSNQCIDSTTTDLMHSQRCQPSDGETRMDVGAGPLLASPAY